MILKEVAGKLEEAIGAEDWNEAKSCLNDIWDLLDASGNAQQQVQADPFVVEEEQYKEKRKNTSRLYRFWCWFWYGHDHDENGHTMNHCNRCGAYWAGSD